MRLRKEMMVVEMRIRWTLHSKGLESGIARRYVGSIYSRIQPKRSKLLASCGHRIHVPVKLLPLTFKQLLGHKNPPASISKTSQIISRLRFLFSRY